MRRFMAHHVQYQLIIEEPGKPNCSLFLTEQAYIIGRSSKSDIQLKNDFVSAQHVQLIKEGAGYAIADLNSSNGTFVNGHRLENIQPLREGDIISIGNQRGKVIRMTFSGVSDSRQADEGQRFDTVSAMSIEHLLCQPSFIIGRGDDAPNKLVLNHPIVSRRHAEILQIADGHGIRDLHSVNGTFVNGEAVRGQRRLQEKDIIRIGPFKFVYSYSGLEQGSLIDNYRLDAVRLQRQVTQLSSSSFRGLVQKISQGKSLWVQKVILNNVTLSIYPKEFVALVGGSGAGKSTLMKALSGFVPADKGSQVLLNGDDLYANFANYQKIVGYVPQDDIVHHYLTVRGALYYAAQLRLPPDLSRQDLEASIDRVLEQVEMTEHAHKTIRQLSGGQRKRVSIAVELLAEPGLFFLDEPTSGLDPGLEKKMMETLRHQANAGRTIVLVTHATANITLCTHVAFMCDGYLVYFGPPNEAREYFGAEEFADIYTRLMQPQTRAASPDGSTTSNGEIWAERFHRSSQYQTYIQSRIQAGTTSAQAIDTPRQSILRKMSALWQFRVLTQRYFELVFRDLASLLTLLLVMPFIGLLILIMANPHDLTGKSQEAIRIEIQEEIDEERTAQDPNRSDEQFSGSYIVVGPAQKLLFMLALAANLLGIFAAAYEIIKEEAIYQRERLVDLKIPPYLLSKIIVLGLFALFQCALLLGVVGLRLTYPSEGIFLPPLLEIFLSLFLATLASISLGLFISAIVRSSNTVIYVILIVLFIQIIFAGAIFELPMIAKPISYLTTTRWSLEALGSTVNMPRLREESVGCIEVENKPTHETKAPCKTNQLRQSIDFVFHVEYQHQFQHLITRWLVLLGFTVLFFAATAWIQKRKDVI